MVTIVGNDSMTTEAEAGPMPRKRKYVPNLAKFFFKPDTWTVSRARAMFYNRPNPSENIPLDIVFYEDCIEGLRKTPQESVDLVIADPPFGIEFDGKSSVYNRDASFVINGYSEIDRDYDAFTNAWIREVPRVMKDSASAYIFSGWNNLRHVERACEDNNLTIVSHLIWKYNFGVFTWRKFVTSHYHILFVVKDTSKYYFNKVRHYPEDVWLFKREYRPHEWKNGTKLPLELVQECIDFSSKPGDVILDPFMGNGTTAAAAKTKFRHFLGFESNPALKRIIDHELDIAQLGEDYVWFDRRAYLRELKKEYPRVARIYEKMKNERGGNKTGKEQRSRNDQ